MLIAKNKEKKSSDLKAGVILPFGKETEYYVEPLGVIPKKLFYSFLKRLFDIVISFCCLVVLALPLCIVALVIKLTSHGCCFYLQERLGTGGKKFNIVKFRTMVDDAEQNGAQWCIDDNDKRVTPLGRFLRKYHIDELPQLWCIFIGTMSFVGPRPERECFYNEFETYIHGFSERLKVKPGLTGLAQVSGDHRMKPEEKIVYDIEYIKTRSLLKDIKIIFKTVKVLFK